jgi:hypothetical protein
MNNTRLSARDYRQCRQTRAMSTRFWYIHLEYNSWETNLCVYLDWLHAIDIRAEYRRLCVYFTIDSWLLVQFLLLRRYLSTYIERLMWKCRLLSRHTYYTCYSFDSILSLNILFTSVSLSSILNFNKHDYSVQLDCFLIVRRFATFGCLTVKIIIFLDD